MIKAPNPHNKLAWGVLDKSHKETTMAITGITGPNGTLNDRSLSFIVCRKTNTAKQVGMYCTNREIAEIMANRAKVPE